MRQALVLPMVGVTLGLFACGDPVPPPAPLPAAAPDHTIQAGAWRVSAIGEREGDVLHVRQLEVRAPGASAPVQTIDGLQTDTPWPSGAPGLEAPDMNFDGHPDLRLIEFRAAGPNTPWRHWLFDATQQRFVASAALDALSPTRFDDAQQRVIVDWRDGAARSGSDAYIWRDGALVPATIRP